MTLAQTEPKKIYIWVEESGWQPGANTIAYYPLTSTDTVNDKSGNGYNLTNNSVTFGTYAGVDCANMTGSYYLSQTSIPLPSGSTNRTFSFWFYNTSLTGDTYWFAYGSHSNGMFFAPRIDRDRYGFMGYNKDFITTTSVSLNTRQNVILTYDGAYVRYYVNGAQIITSTQSLSTTAVGGTWKFVIGCRLNSSANPGNYVTGYMGDFIVEDVVWDAATVLDYYNLTKSKYGL